MYLEKKGMNISYWLLINMNIAKEGKEILVEIIIIEDLDLEIEIEEGLQVEIDNQEEDHQGLEKEKGINHMKDLETDLGIDHEKEDEIGIDHDLEIETEDGLLLIESLINSREDRKPLLKKIDQEQKRGMTLKKRRNYAKKLWSH
jgi:hypothetical protein